MQKTGTIFDGARYLLRGFGLISRPGLRKFVIAPLLINILIFALGMVVLGNYFQMFMDWALAWLPDWEWLSWLRSLLWFLFVILAALIVFYTFSIIANIVAAPFNGLLSARVEAQFTGKIPAFAESFGQMLGRTLRSEVAKLSYLLTRLLGLALLSLFLMIIPGLQILIAPMWFLFGAWILALEYMDYPLNNNGGDFRFTKQYAKNHRVLSWGFGGVTALLTSLPIINFFVMPAAVAGGTLLWVENPAPISTAGAKH